MFIPNLVESPDCSVENEPLPKGYSEAINDCTALATNLLNKAITGDNIERCWDCSEWAGICKKGHVWRIARDEACSEFTSKTNKNSNKTTGDTKDD
jgi:hypothetical protein